MIFALSLSTWSDQRKHAAIFCGWEKLTQNAFSPGHSLPVLIYFRYEELKDFHNKPRRININGVHCESTQVSRKFPGRSAAWENARSLATDGKAEQCRLPMFLSGLVKTKHLGELQKQSGRVAQTPTERLCLHLELEIASICIFCICWSQYCCSFEIEVQSKPHCSMPFFSTNINWCPKEYLPWWPGMTYKWSRAQ